MLARKLAVLVAAVAVSAPALAERGHRDHRHVQHYPAKHHPVAQRGVVHHAAVHHYYRPAPRQVVVVHRPAPVVYHQVSRPHTGAAIVFGAILGAAIAHTVITAY